MKLYFFRKSYRFIVGVFTCMGIIPFILFCHDSGNGNTPIEFITLAKGAELGFYTGSNTWVVNDSSAMTNMCQAIFGQTVDSLYKYLATNTVLGVCFQATPSKALEGISEITERSDSIVVQYRMVKPVIDSTSPPPNPGYPYHIVRIQKSQLKCVFIEGSTN